MAKRKTEKQFWEEYYGQLVGGVIKGFGIIEEDDGYWPCFIVKLITGEEVQVEVSQDEEGNGPGFLSGLPKVGGISE
jgi:hypothetical protein